MRLTPEVNHDADDKYVESTKHDNVEVEETMNSTLEIDKTTEEENWKQKKSTELIRLE